VRSRGWSRGHRHRRLLRAYRKRPRHSRAAERG
jgi:hypothetical protein